MEKRSNRLRVYSLLIELSKNTAATSQVSQAGDAAAAEAQLTEVNRDAKHTTGPAKQQTQEARQ